MKEEKMGFAHRCTYAFMGFFSSALLFTLICGSCYVVFRIGLDKLLFAGGIFTLAFTLWGFIAGEKMIEELSHLWGKYMGD
ncbi:hypothetical protein PQO01_02180 [Lentisphaera marina]|uniref:hypothetical protein n=1 Tax=Lentisphaera marina TaxID=1111041 RepID=UPI0023670D21|nr:hypothetical protein [Lentisphaera marina]MDD7983753.1 hypothetical protein [Lentisphaera marina]